MLTIASLLAATTIAGAFWVGVLAARRLRDWGDGRQALDEGGRPLALPAPGDPDAAAIRLRLAEYLAAQGGFATGSSEREEVQIDTLRSGDVVSLFAGDASVDGDFIVDGIVRMREGTTHRTVIRMVDGTAERWLITDDTLPWLLADPIREHGLRGEPPRSIALSEGRFDLSSRAQVSVACNGNHGRPEGRRTAVYRYTGALGQTLWVERWADVLIMARGRAVERHHITLLPGAADASAADL